MNYTGYLLTEESRKKLMELYPPTFSTFLGHHITEQFGVPSDTPAPHQPSSVKVVGYVRDDKVEGFSVAIDGETNRASGGKYHITWSIDKDKGARPAHTNDIIGQAESIQPITITVTPKLFTRSTEAYLKT